MKTYLGILLFLNISILSVFSQRGDCKAIKNTTAIKLYNKAYVLPKSRYKEALNLLNKAINIKGNYVDAHYKIAEIMYNQANKLAESNKDSSKIKDCYYKAEKEFLRVIELCPLYNYSNSFYYLADLYYKQKDFEPAKQFLETFMEHNSEGSEFYESASKMLDHLNEYFDLLNNPVPFKPFPLKDVCSNADEFLPVMSPDEEILLYSKRSKTNPNAAYGKTNEQLIISFRDWRDSSIYRFTPGKPMGKPFNDGRTQGAATITIDNNHIFITICEYERSSYTSVKNCDIFTSDFINGKWTPLRRMSSNINGKNSFEGMPSISSDGNILYFASAREGSYGGIDIYKSIKSEKGIWGEAQNLGPVINTAADDKTPFIHSDSQTLYFASNGRHGMGGFDVFYSQYEGMGKWSEPKNMGYPINTVNDELGLVVSADGKRIFFSSKSYNKDGNWDIYTAKLYAQARPKRVLFVKGKVKDAKGNEVSDAEVGLRGLESKQKASGMVNESSGKYAIAIPVLKNVDYLLTVQKDKYLFDSKLINTSNELYEPPSNIDLKINKVEKNKAFRLNNVNFAYGSHKLNNVSKLSINQLIEVLKKNEHVNIILKGHTDNKGTPEFNMALSILRVQAVRKYILQKGIDAKRVSYKGYGETKPLKTNNTEAGRKINRRVEFIITTI